MTPKQESQIFEDIGELKSVVKEGRAETKRALNLITGNGRPEDGILYIMTDIRKDIKLLNEWAKGHDIVHTSVNDCITKHDARLTEIETHEKVAVAERAWSNRFMEWAKTHPKTAIGGGIVILSSLGFSADKIINMLITVREIAEKLGVK